MVGLGLSAARPSGLCLEPGVKSSKAFGEAHYRLPSERPSGLALVEPMCRAELLCEEAGHRRIILPPPALPDPGSFSGALSLDITADLCVGATPPITPR